MLFNSGDFLLFFPAVTLVYFLLPRRIRWVWLLISSYYFYMCWEPVYALLLLTSTAITYLSGIAIGRFSGGAGGEKRPARRKLAVAFSFAANLGILAFFKYFDFAADNLCRALSAVGVSLTRPAFSVLLPVGISFYTFQALGYTMDVYRGDTPVERNFFRYALFVSFFPQLASGPIGRSPHLLGQMQKPTGVDYDRIRKGLMLMLWGYFQKLVIADRAAIFVDSVYREVAQHAGFTIVLATVLFAVQLYCDFGGYSAIAIGAAQVLGFDLRPNFRQPYFATSVADFWRRWHISLSTWFRDYLYIPLGGSRCAPWRKYLNIMITFLASGLWHGASWNFVLWGGLNGAMQIVGDWKDRARRAVRRRLGKKEAEERKPFSATLLKRLITFALINVTWIFFRAASAREGLRIFARIFRSFNPWVFFDGSLARLGLSAGELGWLAAAIAALFFVDVLHEKGHRLREELMEQQLWFRFAIYLLGLFSVALLGVYGMNVDAGAFLYFQF